jgi:hypothetical protein
MNFAGGEDEGYFGRRFESCHGFGRVTQWQSITIVA